MSADAGAPSRLGLLPSEAGILQMSSGTTGQRKAIRFDAIEAIGGTVCFLPNFGFEAMTRHANGGRFPTMRRRVSCSEPVYASTLERFAAATATPVSRLSACYAMAESVFAVWQCDGLNTVEHEGRPIVSCGRAVPGVDGRAATCARRDAVFGAELPLQLVEDRDFFLRTDQDDVASRARAAGPPGDARMPAHRRWRWHRALVTGEGNHKRVRGRAVADCAVRSHA